MDSFSEFIKRVHTFTIEKWPMRHYKLTPLRLARWGFQFNTVNSIICQYCREVLSLEDYPFEIDDVSDLNSYVQNFLQRIRKCHQENCLFHKVKDQNSLFKIGYKFIYLYAKKFYENNLMTYQNISQLPQLSPSFKELIPQTFQLAFSDSAKLLHENIINAAKCLSIFGWSCQIISDCEKSLQCQFCGRTVNFSQFELCDNSQDLNVPVDGKPVFDPFENHRYFCKWASLDNDSKKLNGYSILVQELYNDFLEYNQNECKQSKFNQVVQINVMRREMVSQLERIKKEQQNLNQALDQLEQDNKQVIQRISKRRPLEFVDMVDEESVRDKIVKKLKLLQEKNQPEEKKNQKHDNIFEDQKDLTIEQQKKQDQQTDNEKPENLQLPELAQQEEQYSDQAQDLNQNNKLQEINQTSVEKKLTLTQGETFQEIQFKTQVQMSIQNINAIDLNEQQNEEIKQDQEMVDDNNQSGMMDDQDEEPEQQSQEDNNIQIERSIFQSMEGENQQNGDYENPQSQPEIVEEQQNERMVSFEIVQNPPQYTEEQRLIDSQINIEIEPTDDQ